MRRFQMYVQSASQPIACVTHVRLFLAAMVMQAGKRQRLDLEQDGCDGRVTTAWESANIGSIAGTLFEAEIDAEEGSTHVTFICRAIDLEMSAELAKQGVPFLELFSYLDDEGEVEAMDQTQWN